MDSKPVVGAWHDPLAFVIAVWLLAAPFFLGFPAIQHPATIVMWLAAVLMFMSAYDILVLPGVADEWLDAAVGLGLFLSPWLFGYSDMTAATLNALAVGMVVILCAVLAYGRDHNWHWHVPGKHGQPRDGEPAATDALRRHLAATLKWSCNVPEYLEAEEIN